MDKRAAVLRWIEEQEALAAKASAGPWRPGPYYKSDIHSERGRIGETGIMRGVQGWEDAAFIAASRSVLPLALAALRATVEGIRHEEVEDCWYTCPLALDNAGESLCCDEREVAAGRCTCGADARLDAIFCSLGLQEEKV